MKVEYAEHALSDLVSIAAYYASIDNPAAGATVAASIRDVVARAASAPASGRPVAQRPGVRVAAMLRFRYNVFYAVTGDRVRILHIRHTSRRPWTGDDDA